MRGALLVIAILIAPACGDGGETGVDLTIRYDPEDDLDRFALSVEASGQTLVGRTLLPEEARPLSASGREAVVVLLSDDLDGRAVILAVDGLRDGDVRAAGEVTARLQAGELVAAEVRLED